jgi:hypothetical protein
MQYSNSNDTEKNTMLRNSLLQNAGGEVLGHVKDLHDR